MWVLSGAGRCAHVGEKTRGIMPKAARRTGGGQHSRSAINAALRVKERAIQAQGGQASRTAQVQQASASRAAADSKQRADSNAGSSSPANRPRSSTASSKAAAAQREWNDPIWLVRGPGDNTTGEDSFDVRVDRVVQMCRTKWPADVREKTRRTGARARGSSKNAAATPAVPLASWCRMVLDRASRWRR